MEHKIEINIQKEQREDIRLKKNKKIFKKTHKDTITKFWDISKTAKIRLIGVPKGEEEEQEIENLLEKMMKESFPNFGE